jgi:hypothetical protein
VAPIQPCGLCAHGDCSAPCGASIRATLWGELSCHHASPDQRSTPVPPYVPRHVASFLLFASCGVDSPTAMYPCTHGCLSSLCPLLGGLLVPSHVPETTWSRSRTTMCPPESWSTSLSPPLAGWAPMLPCVSGPMARLSYCHVSSDP